MSIRKVLEKCPVVYIDTLWRKNQFYLTRTFTFTRQHGVAFQQINIFRLTAVLTSHVTDTHFYRHRQHTIAEQYLAVHEILY
jgi:hypothetical protein